MPQIPLPTLDTTFKPTILHIEEGIYNFGYFKIHRDNDGFTHLSVSIIGEDGLPRPSSNIDFTPQQNITGN